MDTGSKSIAIKNSIIIICFKIQSFIKLLLLLETISYAVLQAF